MEEALLNALKQAQAVSKAVLIEAFAGMDPSATRASVQDSLNALARQRGVTLLEPARVGSGRQGALLGSFARPAQAISLPGLVTLDIRVVHGQVAGDYARTAVVGDDGRGWFYRRIAAGIHRTLHQGLADCKTLEDGWELARELTYRQGGRLLGGPADFGHPLEMPLSGSPRLERLKGPLNTLQRRALCALPGKLASPRLAGAWSIEPLLELDRHLFRFEDAVVFEEGRLLLEADLEPA